MGIMKGERFDVDHIKYIIGCYTPRYGQDWDIQHDTTIYFWDDFVIMERKTDPYCNNAKEIEPEVVMIPKCNVLEIINPRPAALPVVRSKKIL